MRFGEEKNIRQCYFTRKIFLSDKEYAVHMHSLRKIQYRNRQLKIVDKKFLNDLTVVISDSELSKVLTDCFQGKLALLDPEGIELNKNINVAITSKEFVTNARDWRLLNFDIERPGLILELYIPHPEALYWRQYAIEKYLPDVTPKISSIIIGSGTFVNIIIWEKDIPELVKQHIANILIGET